MAKEGKRGILGETVQKWTGEISEKATPVLIDEFIVSISSRFPDVFEWLKFAAQGEDIANFLNSRLDVSAWPSELKRTLSSFLSSKYAAARSSIERGLEGFRRPPASKSVPQIPKLEGERKRVTVQTEVQTEESNAGVSEKAEKEKHPIGILIRGIGSSSIRVLTERELTDYLQKKANDFAASDSKMMEDFRTIVTSLRKDPYGFGTKKLKDMSVGVDKSRSLPVRSMDPGDRIGLHLEHPESQKIRIAFVIYKNEDGSVVVIEGIYNHDDYDSKFGP